MTKYNVKICVPSLLALILISFSTSVLAKERGTPEEAVAMVKAVKKMVLTEGITRTHRAITYTKKFRKKDLYPFLYHISGVIVAHGILETINGKDLNSLKDADGKFLIQEFVKLIKKQPSGWLEYKWPNVLTGKNEKKISYLERINSEYFVGVGVYPK